MRPESTISIRDAAPEDAAPLAALLNAIIELGSYTALDTLLTAEEERRYIEAFPERGVFHVAVRASDGRIVGCQTLEPFSTGTHAFDHVGMMGTYVDLACHRQGVGRALFEATFEAGRRKGYEKIFTWVRADNDAGLRAYLGQGFRVVGRAERHAKIRGRYVDEVMIERFL
jgi:L-amino acid N-acyltransferase YncA